MNPIEPKLKVKKRPPRVYQTKKGRYYIKQNGKKIYIDIPYNPNLSQKQIQRQIVNVVLTHPRYHVPLKRRKRTFSKSGKVYFNQPILPGMVASSFGFANTGKNVIGKQPGGIYAPHTLPDFIPKPSLEKIPTKAETLLLETPASIDKEQKMLEEKLRQKIFTLMKKGIELMNMPKKVPEFNKLNIDRKKDFVEKLKLLYPDYRKELDSISKLNNNLITGGLNELNIPYKKIYPKVDELIELLSGQPTNQIERMTNFIVNAKSKSDFQRFIQELEPETNPNVAIPAEPGFHTREIITPPASATAPKLAVSPESVVDYFNRKEGLSPIENELENFDLAEEKKLPPPSKDLPIKPVMTTREKASHERQLGRQLPSHLVTTVLKKSPEMIEYEALTPSPPLSPDTIERLAREQESKFGEGKYSNWRRGLYDTEIHKILEHKAKRFVPVIMSDEIPKLLPYVSPKTKEFAFVINSTSSKTNGQHWRAVFIDVPNSEIDYYDSLVSQPTKEFLRDIKMLVDKINPSTYMKLKINMIKQQNDRTENCGFFACKFIIDRFKNKPFKNASGGDKSNIGEYEIEKFKNYI
jgi:hypothetical protein